MIYVHTDARVLPTTAGAATVIVVITLHINFKTCTLKSAGVLPIQLRACPLGRQILGWSCWLS
uniref:Uncharacterized protein n=1 Tax=Glossina palpalis gambiensis TaxID=67801 RepID=A0A1B0BQG7_9MUSC